MGPEGPRLLPHGNGHGRCGVAGIKGFHRPGDGAQIRDRFNVARTQLGVDLARQVGRLGGPARGQDHAVLGEDGERTVRGGHH